MKKIAILLLFTIVPISHASADHFLTLGLAAGTAGQQYSDVYTDIAGISGTTARDSSIGIRLGIPLSEYMVIEGAFYDYGEANDNYIDGFGDLIGVKLATTSLNFGVAGIFPIHNTPADLVGRIGFAAWETDVEFTDSSFPGDILTGNDSGVSIYFGFGLRTYVTKNIRLGLEYTFMGLDTYYIDVAGEQVIDNFALTVDVEL